MNVKEDVLPLPGIPELGDMVRSMIKRSKESGYKDDKGALLAARLENLLIYARQLDDPSELKRELTKIHQEFRTAAQSHSRSKVLNAQHKLATWDELDAKINKLLDTTLLCLVTQFQQFQKQIVVRASESKLSVIESYNISNQAEVAWQYPFQFFHPDDPLSQRRQLEFITSCRRGCLGTLSVTYKKFVMRSGASAAELVEAELEQLSSMSHSNVAALVGVTQGYRGLDGLIVVSNTLPLDQFIMRSYYSGAAWAECIQGLMSYQEANQENLGADDIAVGVDGSLTVMPSFNEEGFFSTNLMDLCDYVPLEDWDNVEPAVRLFLGAFCDNAMDSISPELYALVDSCRSLGQAFTELQFAKVAASSGILPILSYNNFSWTGSQQTPKHVIRTGDFGCLTSHAGVADTEQAWVPLGDSHYFNNQTFLKCRTVDGITRCKLVQTENGQWLSVNMCECLQNNYDRAILIVTFPRLINGCEWKAILTEAQQISQLHHTPLDNIHLCKSSSYVASVNVDPNPQTPEMAGSLYFHCNRQTRDSREAWGFFSTSADPKCLVSRAVFEHPGRTPLYEVNFSTYHMSNDWDRLYRRILETGVANIPGSYPGASIEDP